MGIVLIGYRGSGKTSAGRLLGERLGKTFVDLDTVVTDRVQMTIIDIFRTRGENEFRDIESAELQRAIENDAVISTGGGVILRETNRQALIASRHVRIYLRCEAAELHRRIHADPATAANRPALTHLGGGIDEIVSLLAVREPLYREVMTHEIDVTTLGISEVVSHLLQLIPPQMHDDAAR